MFSDRKRGGRKEHDYRNEERDEGWQEEQMDERREQRTNQLTIQPYTADSFVRS
jgi:hypothetical protein